MAMCENTSFLIKERKKHLSSRLRVQQVFSGKTIINMENKWNIREFS
ncbi:MAG: hypothetical protein ACTSVI_12135 [Promethearchaeota archaeon]